MINTQKKELNKILKNNENKSFYKKTKIKNLKTWNMPRILK